MYGGSSVDSDTMSPEKWIRVETAQWAWGFAVDEDGRLVQTSVGAKDREPGEPVLAVPTGGNLWTFDPAFQVVHADGNPSADFRYVSHHVDGDTTVIVLRDPAYSLTLDLCFRPVSELDVIEAWTVVRHEGSGAVRLEAFASSSLDLGPGAFWLTQFHGDWADEVNMVTERLTFGRKVLDSKLGVRAHQFFAPWFLVGRDAAPTEDTGEVFAGTLAWSGSFCFNFEILPGGRLRVNAGMNSHQSAYHLAPGETFTTPKMVWAWSDTGTGDLSRRLHRYVRSEVVRDGNAPRDIVLNNWEATYFSFDEAKIVSLFDGARDLGMELFLLDDGWFGDKYARDGDHQGLGDWFIDPKKLPNGLGVLVEGAQAKGLRFGLWFEPEMVNPKSELFEAHPDWLIQQPKREFDLSRNQMVLDLTNPEVKAFAFRILDETLSANPGITYVKWDCNRYFTQAGSPYLPMNRQSHLQIAYVHALYEVMEQLASKHPHVQVMMCSGGGGRVDYAALRYAHEIWPSDMTDPVRRVFIQWGYSYFLPALTLPGHVTDMGKRPLKFAFDVAMSGRLGMDMDVDKLSDDERTFAKARVAAYKEMRDVVQLGTQYRLESPYDGPRSSLMFVHGDEAVVFVYSLGDAPSSGLPLKGIDGDKTYRVQELDSPSSSCLVGAVLRETGLEVPDLAEMESRVYRLRVV